MKNEIVEIFGTSSTAVSRVIINTGNYLFIGSGFVNSQDKEAGASNNTTKVCKGSVQMCDFTLYSTLYRHHYNSITKVHNMKHNILV